MHCTSPSSSIFYSSPTLPPADPARSSQISHTASGLELFDLISKASRGSSREDGHVSAAEISSLLPTQNPQAPAMLDRMLWFLAGASFLTCNVVINEEDSPKRLYKLAPLAQLLVKNEDIISLAHLVDLSWDRVFIDSWCCLKVAIFEGGVPFDRAHMMNAFEYPSQLLAHFWQLSPKLHQTDPNSRSNNSSNRINRDNHNNNRAIIGAEILDEVGEIVVVAAIKAEAAGNNHGIPPLKPAIKVEAADNNHNISPLRPVRTSPDFNSLRRIVLGILGGSRHGHHRHAHIPQPLGTEHRRRRVF